MNEFEEQLKAGLSAEVGEWTPTPGEVRRAAAPPTRPHLRIALVAGLVVLVAGSGIGAAFGLRSGSKHRGVTLVQGVLPDPVASELASLDPTPVELPSVVPLADGTPTAALPVIVDSAPAGPGPTLGSIAPSLPDARFPSARPSTTGAKSVQIARFPAPCTSRDLHLTLTTDQASYLQTQPVHIAVSSLASGNCEADEPEVMIQQTGAKNNVWATCHGQPPTPTPLASVCTASLEVFNLKPGATHSASYDWDMVTMPATTNKAAAYLQPGDYTVTYSWGSVSVTGTFQVADPPTCTSDQLTPRFTADKDSYARGEVAHLTGSVVNTSQQLCSASAYFAEPTATDASGSVIWDCGVSSGLPRGSFCGTASVGYLPQPLAPGATLPDGDYSTAPHTWDWSLVHDGTKDTDPGPVPDGSYTLSWTGLDGNSATTSVTVTVTG